MNKSVETFFYEALGRWTYYSFHPLEVEDPRSIQTPPEVITKKITDWVELSENCQSPIEQILLAELLFITNGYHEVITQTDHFDDDFYTLLDNQVEVLNYRADFLLTVRNRDLTRTLIIECDGHDFHEKTKEQAKRDKSRDRALIAAGHTVLRFTGSEIYNNSRQCAEEVGNILGDLAEEIMGGLHKNRRDTPNFSSTNV